MASFEVEQTLRFIHSFEVEGIDDEELDDFIDGQNFEDLDDIKVRLCREFGSDNVNFIEDGSGIEEIDIY